MTGDRTIWEDILKEQFDFFLKKAALADVPEVYTLTFLKAEVEKLDERVQRWVAAGKDLHAKI